MTTAIKRRRGTTTQHSTFTGLEGELTVDTTKETVVVHDGSTAGGFPLLREDLSNNTNVLTASNTKTLTNKSIDLGSNTVTGTVAQFNAAVTDGDLLTTTGTETLTNKTLTSPTINGNVATTGINFDSNTFVIDATNDRVGVGTSTPGTKLDVNGVVTATGGTSTNWNSAFGWGNHASAGYAADSSVVHLAGTETISGAKTFSTAPTVAGLSNSGNLTFTGTGNRITGDFGNGTIANRVAFQSSTTNGATVITALPNGTGTQTQYEVFNSSDTTNSSRGQFFMNASELSIRAQITGTGSYLPITAWTGGSERLRIDTSGNVGIGTSTIQWGSSGRGLIEVNGSSAAMLGFDVGGVGKAYLFHNGTDYFLTNTANGPLILGSNNTERMRINSSGNVGIGTTNPTYKLDMVVASSASNVNGINLTNATNASFETYLRNDVTTLCAGGTGNFVFANGGSVTERMRIDSSGNVGIGTSSPAQKLHVQGGAIEVDNGGGAGTVYFVDTNAYINYSSSTMQFAANGAERMRITSDGELLVGTTSSTPTGTNNSIIIRPGSSSYFSASATNAVAVSRYTSTGTLIVFDYAGATKGTISTDGTNVAYNTSSDYRLKENIIDLSNALQTVSNLKPRQFDWKETGVTTTGFIAHELAEVLPQAVTGEKDAVDAEGKPVYQGVDTSFLVATLTAAIQEQQTMIEELKASNDAIKAEVAALKSNS